MAKPIIHSGKDPAGTKRIRGRASEDLRGRVRSAGIECQKKIYEFLKSHENGYVVVNSVDDDGVQTNERKYLYVVDVEETQQIDLLIDRIVNQWLMDGRGLWSPQWYWSQWVDPAYESGASDSLQSLQNLSEAQFVGQEVSSEVRGLQIQQVLMMPEFRRPMQLLSSRTFNAMEGLTGDMIKDLRFILSQSVADGVSARVAAKRIAEKVWEGDKGYVARALRIARTEINGAYAQAYMETNDYMDSNVYDKGGFAARVMHLSALTQTTRPEHARRHGTIHTADEQSLWWSEGGNRINCLCSITTVLVDKETGEVLQKNLYETAIEQGEKWFMSRGIVK